MISFFSDSLKNENNIHHKPGDLSESEKKPDETFFLTVNVGGCTYQAA